MMSGNRLFWRRYTFFAVDGLRFLVLDTTDISIPKIYIVRKYIVHLIGGTCKLVS